MSAKKVIQESKTETCELLEGLRENTVLLDLHQFSTLQRQIKETEKKRVTRPNASQEGGAVGGREGGCGGRSLAVASGRRRRHVAVGQGH